MRLLACCCLLLQAVTSTATAVDPSLPFALADPPPPPFAGPGVAFGQAFSDHAVLQQAPATAAVYGVVIGSGATGVNVSVAPANQPGAAYSIQAQHFERVNSTYFRWKAELRPTKAGSAAHTITATCIGCSVHFQATIHDVVFGEVWLCVGECAASCPDPCNSDSTCAGRCSCDTRTIQHVAADGLLVV